MAFSGPEPADYPKPAYAWYVVAILLVAGITSFLDRYLLALLIAPIRAYLHINDTQVSFLQGFAFALVYVAAGLPFGRLVDRTSRRNVIIVGVVVWSLFTIGCGLAETYWQMFVARLGVGIGEACLGPAAFSLIADYFPSHQRGRAMSVYNLSNYLGSGASLLIGGMILKGLSASDHLRLPLLSDIPAWKATFLVAGTPGLLVAFLLLSVREPSRKEIGPRHASVAGDPGIGAYLRPRWAVYSALYFVFISIAFIGLTNAAWSPALFVRQFGLTPARVGVLIGPVSILFGTVGALTSGVAGDWLVKRGSNRFRIPLVALPIMICGTAGLSFAPSLPLAMVAQALVLFGSGLGLVAGPPTFQDITPNRLRGQVQALYYMLSGLLGLGLAPTAVALVTDYVFHSDQAVGYSLAVVLIPVSMLACLICLLFQPAYGRLLRPGFPSPLRSSMGL